MLLIPANQFNQIEDSYQKWLNTIAYAAMVLWSPESNNISNNVVYRLNTTSTYDIYNIVFIAQKLWTLTAHDREKHSKTGYDYNSLKKVGYNHDFCTNIIADNTSVGNDFNNIVKQNLNVLASELINHFKNPYYSPDIPLNFIIAAANVYATILGNSERTTNISSTYFKPQKLEHLPEITTCSLDFIHNSVNSMPLTLTDFRIMKHYEVKISYDTDLYNVTAHRMLSDYIYYQLTRETPKIDYIIADYESGRIFYPLSDAQINSMLSDPLGMSKLVIYKLTSSALSRLANYDKPCYEQALTAYKMCDEHYKNFIDRRTFYNNLLELVNKKCRQANQISYDYSSFDYKKFIQTTPKPTIYHNYVNDYFNIGNSHYYSIRLTNNQCAIWTNVRHLAKILAPDFVKQLFVTPYNMWETLLDSDYDMLDETLSKLELALYNMVGMSVYLQPIPTSISWGAKKYHVFLHTLKASTNPIFSKINTNIEDYVNISTRLNLKISDYYNFFTPDNDRKKKNRLKIVNQINQVLEWLEKVLEIYSKTKVGRIITNGIKVV